MRINVWDDSLWLLNLLITIEISDVSPIFESWKLVPGNWFKEHRFDGEIQRDLEEIKAPVKFDVLWLRDRNIQEAGDNGQIRVSLV